MAEINQIQLQISKIRQRSITFQQKAFAPISKNAFLQTAPKFQQDTAATSTVGPKTPSRQSGSVPLNGSPEVHILDVPCKKSYNVHSYLDQVDE